MLGGLRSPDFVHFLGAPPLELPFDKCILEGLSPTRRSVALEALQKGSFFKGSGKGSRQGSRKRAIWENCPNPMNSFKRDLENTFFPRKIAFDANLHIKITCLPNMKMAYMIHMITFRVMSKHVDLLMRTYCLKIFNVQISGNVYA